VTIKCPKCQSENTDTAHFCNSCAAPLHPSEEISASHTETLETPREELTTGSTFAGRYQIIEELGEGGMGKVYKAQDIEIREKVALKLLKPEIATDEKTIERFRNELKFARKIAHRNVCKMYDLGEEKGTRYIIMEYVPGEDLKDTITRIGQLPIAKTVSIAKQVCEGLAEAHRAGVVHRDLKPQNIMIDKEGNVRIMDFGIARSVKVKGITGAGVMIGTPEYMSPEQAEVKEIDQRSDIYSLGVILYEMATGRIPFEGETALSIAMKHKSKEPKDPKEINAQIPEDLSRVILRCMEKDKEKRYQSADEVRSELTKIEEGIPTTERVVPKKKSITSKEITVTFGLKKLFIPSLVVAAIAVIAVIIWQLLPQKETVFAPKIENSIAVISFKNQTGDKAYDYLQEAIPNLLITSLEQTGYLYVATWERMYDLLKQMRKGDVEVIDRDLGFKLCRMEGIEAIVLGSFIKAGDMFATDVKVLDVETKKLLKSTSSKGEGIDSILKTQIDELSREVAQGIGIARQKIEEAKMHISDVTTTSMEAYNYYLKGKEEFFKNYLYEAQQSLEKAVSIDPTFASAYLYLSNVYGSLENLKLSEETLKKAKTFSEKATDKERLLIESVYAAGIEQNPDKSLHIFEKIVEKYPKEKQAHLWLGIAYYSRNSYDEAVEELNKALELDPDYGESLNMIAYAYTGKGDFENAIEYFKKYASIDPGDANPFDSIAELYFRMGRLDESIAKYKKALEIKPDFGSDFMISYIYAFKENYSEAMKWIEQFISMAPSPGKKAGGHIWKGLLHYWLGNLNQSLGELQKAEDLVENIGNELWKARLDVMKGWIYYDRRKFELSLKYHKNWYNFFIKYAPLFKHNLEVQYLFALGLLDLKQGRIDSAKSRANEMKSLLPKVDSTSKDQMKFIYDLLNGEVLLAEGLAEKAIAVCEQTSPLGFPSGASSPINAVSYNLPFAKDLLARAYKQKGELDNAISEYERLITFNPNSKERFLIQPKYHYRLAKLYQEKGWKGKAMEHYEKFLEFFKEADPGIVEVEDSRKRVAELKSQ